MPDMYNQSPSAPETASPAADSREESAGVSAQNAGNNGLRSQSVSGHAKQGPATTSAVFQEPATKVVVRPVGEAQKDRTHDASAHGATPSVNVQVKASPAKVPATPVNQTAQKPLSDDDVTAHTASLWKYLPIPENEPEPYPEYINGTVNFPGSRVISARVRGKKHKHEGTNCDDWYELAHLDNITFVVVSDGAGSKQFSRIGAMESCKAAIGYLVRSFRELLSSDPDIRKKMTLPLNDPKCGEACGLFAGIVQKSVIAAYDAVEAAFALRKGKPEYRQIVGRELDFKDFSGTLLIAVMIPVNESTKEHLVITCQIGDGMIVAINSQGDFNNSVKLMSVPDSGEYSGQTDFLTSEKMKKIETLQSRTRISRTVVDTVMVMTDGVADDYFPNETQMRRLYFDMIINGILDRGMRELSLSRISPDQMKLFKRVPEPMVYPWVNNHNVKVPIHYTSRIMQATGLSLEDLWKDQTLLAMARRELIKSEKNPDPSLRLRTWLDNYYERGSFDDRTLVLVTM